MLLAVRLVFGCCVFWFGLLWVTSVSGVGVPFDCLDFGVLCFAVLCLGFDLDFVWLRVL